MNKLSKIFQPVLIVPKNAIVKPQTNTSKSQKVRICIVYILGYPPGPDSRQSQIYRGNL